MKKPQFMKQKIMLKVLYALAPLAVASVYFFGWRVIAVLAASMIFGFLTEWFMVSKRNGKITYACFVTSALYGLSLPPTVPIWIAVVGVIIAILFGKEMFGGFGKNIFNPAIVGRAFVYVCFPVELTSKFVPVFRGFPGGFAKWSFESLKELPAHLQGAGLKVADAITAATPMWSRRDYGFETGIIDLLTGNIGGTFEFRGYPQVLAAGSIAEVCGILIILSGIYLLWTKTAQYRLTAGTIIGAVGLNVILRYGFGLQDVPPVLFTLFSGALLYAAVFMVTDPVSAPKVKLSQWIYGIFIGAMIVFFRYKAVFAGGVAFSILMGNALSPSLDLWIKRYRARKESKEAAA